MNILTYCKYWEAEKIKVIRGILLLSTYKQH